MLRGNTDSEPQLEKNKTKMANGREQEKSNESRLVSCALHAKIHSHVERRKQEMRAAAGLKVDGDRRISLVS